MYVIHDGDQLVFLHRNPTYEGFAGQVETDINFYYPDKVHDWPDGTRSPEVCVGVSKENPKWYRVFRSAEECKQAGYMKVVEGTPAVFQSWPDYLLKKLQWQLMPKHANEHVAINLETGEYVLGRTPGEAFRAFEARWPNKPMYKRRVDGGPSVKLRSHGE
jgi:hypothetical protein